MVENELQREAFGHYLAMGGRRSIARLCDQLRGEDPERWPSLRTFYEWSVRLDWQHRLVEHERAASEAADAERRRAYTAMQQRHARVGLLLQSKGAEVVGGLSGDRVTPAAAVRMLSEGVRLERTAEGPVPAPTPPAPGHDPLLEGLTDDELGRLIELIRTGVAGGEPPRSW